MTDKRYQLSRRKALAGLATVGAAGAGAGLGTSALFSDEESFDGNTLTAGELDLFVDYWTDASSKAVDGGTTGSGEIDGDVSAQYVLNDVKPGDEGFLVFCPKVVDNPAYLWAGSDGLTDYENGRTEPEVEVDDSGNAPGGTGGNGELSENIQVTVSYCEYEGGEEGSRTNPENYSGRELNNPDDYTLADLIHELQAGFRISDNEDGTYPASADADTQEGPCLCVEWEVPKDVGNVIQSDSVEFDIAFGAVQARNVSDPASENPFVDAVLTTSDDPSWITGRVSAGPTTVISVDLDDTVYGDWPSNPNSYVMEAIVDISNDGIGGSDSDQTDDFRIGYGGSAAAERPSGTAGGYIKRNGPGSVGRFTEEEENIAGFSAVESPDQQSYTFIIDWTSQLPETPSSTSAPDPSEIEVYEIFGSDSVVGSGSVDPQALNVDPSGPLTL